MQNSTNVTWDSIRMECATIWCYYSQWSTTFNWKMFDIACLRIMLLCTSDDIMWFTTSCAGEQTVCSKNKWYWLPYVILDLHFTRPTAVIFWDPFNPGPAYAGMKAESLPLICKVNISADKPLVDSFFGKLQAGSVLSYEHLPPPFDSVVMHEDAPPFPSVHPEGYHLNPTDCSFVPTHFHFNFRKVSQHI